ncbi:ABC transporter permease [Aneurinibacillus uraniidurans]|uniref:ABC transporter permease n=1 Tax=Aneurinibacillus uraniidurans TaxID=2966586 RepID=UPI002349EE2A|nr:ABC transporter permease [Aneurinibacillus sp. B1]WCN36317.1 ABC transporter permease [Aneurinibacillus sp. B1]
MFHLIKLEIRKFTLHQYIKKVVIADVIILLLLCFIQFADRSDGTVTFVNYDMAFSSITKMTRATFMIFAAVLLAKLIIDEYKTKTIALMFMYPIKRKKLMIAKLLIVGSFTFVTIFLSSVLIGLGFYVVDYFFHLVPTKLTNEIIVTNLVHTCTNALLSACISLLPLYFGMRKKSVPTIIIVAVVIVLFLSSSINNFVVDSIASIRISLAVIGIFTAYLSIRNVEKADVTE